MPEYICPNCHNPIYDDEALLCLYCGESLRRGAGFMGKIKYARLKIITAVLVIVILVIFLIIMAR
ncbi:MAG: hypothetical protein COV72_04520 [Candidatus Omnitrophica bacterium CG11_big_fil_rev_8_21_14_0_20_42_13]|uniref:Uncharacterized protein n=1 Tax=Candidatus Ghiorseimicrobium undicola TaxID=1974746 RepID=A0A2H0M096_9BACT|nr:MAG: hypothetical protein COV72_04520 [Candidatus Omnitrophica bacterium CG11_big_fil_rev_8_21_14_0_20_42_13]